MITYATVCSGIGAPELAVRELGWKCSFMSEIEKFPCAVLRHHFPDYPLHGDFTTIQRGEYDPIDVLIGGTPCQDFSVAGKRLGLDAPRGNLALEYLSLARRLGTRWLVWENVPGILSSWSDDENLESGKLDRGMRGHGRTDTVRQRNDFATFLAFVGQCGFGYAWRVLDGQHFGVPQRRRRVILVGYLGDWRPAAAVLFERESLRRDITPRREAREGVTGGIAPCIRSSGVSTERIGDTRGQDCLIPLVPDLAWALQERDAKGACSSTKEGHLIPIAFDCKASGQNGFGVGEIAPTLRAMDSANGNRNAGGQLAVAIQAGALRENPNSGPDGVGVQENIAYTLEARAEVQAVAMNLRGRDGGAMPEMDELASVRAASGGSSRSYVAAPMAVRRLTPTECERLMDYPDGWTAITYAKKPAADGPRYKALGNSMIVGKMQWVLSRLDQVHKIKAEGGA